MSEKVQGRMWMSAYLKGGQPLPTGPAGASTLPGRLDRIKDALGLSSFPSSQGRFGRERPAPPTKPSTGGREALRMIVKDQTLQLSSIARDVTPDWRQLTLDLPLLDDPFFLATDDRSPDGLKYIRDHGGIVIGDLITDEDRQHFGWPIFMPDVLALVEHAVLVRSYYFYGQALNGVVGHVVNARTARGADERSYFVD